MRSANRGHGECRDGPTRVGAVRKECTYDHNGDGKDNTNTDFHTHTFLYRTSLLVFKV
jgi:hypothetical protein